MPLSNQCKLCERKKTQTKPKNFSAFIECLLKDAMVSSSFRDTGSECSVTICFLACLVSPLLCTSAVCSLLLTCVNRWSSIQRKGLHSGRTAPRLFICSDICRQVWSVLPAPVWTADNRCLPSFSPRSLISTYLSPSPFRWHEFLGPPVLREIFYTLFTKLYQILKQTRNTMHHAEQVMFCQMFMDMTTFYEQSLFFFTSSIAQKIDMQRTKAIWSGGPDLCAHKGGVMVATSLLVVIDFLLTGMGFPLTRMICVFDITFSPWYFSHGEI